MTGVRIPVELDAKLNAWIERQPEPKHVLSLPKGLPLQRDPAVD